MAATIRLLGFEATIDAGKWTCGEKRLQDFLTLVSEEARLRYIGVGSDPNPDYHLAKDVVDRFGAEMVRYDETEYEPGTIY